MDLGFQHHLLVQHIFKSFWSLLCYQGMYVQFGRGIKIAYTVIESESLCYFCSATYFFYTNENP
jgi:hypothetical protein